MTYFYNKNGRLTLLAMHNCLSGLKELGAYLANTGLIDFPDELFQRLSSLGVGIAGQQLVDLGTGRGNFARAFAARGCSVTALDRSPDMLVEALQPESDCTGSLNYLQAKAEDTGLPDEVFDCVVAGQAWHLFDRLKAGQESRRLLKHGGQIAIAQMDWVPRSGGPAEATEEIIQRYNPDWNILFRQSNYMDWSRQLGTTGFRDVQEATFNTQIAVAPDIWRQRIRASAGVGAVLPREMADALDSDLAATLKDKFPGEMLHVSHKVFYLVARG